MKRLSLLFCSLLLLSGINKLSLASEDVPPPPPDAPPPTVVPPEEKPLVITKKTTVSKEGDVVSPETSSESGKKAIFEAIEKGVKLKKGSDKPKSKAIDLISVDGVQEPDFGANLQLEARKLFNQYAQAAEISLTTFFPTAFVALSISSTAKKADQEAFKKFAEVFRDRYQEEKVSKNLFDTGAPVIQEGKKPVGKVRPQIHTVLLAARDPVDQKKWVSISGDETKAKLYNAFLEAIKKTYLEWELTLKKSDFAGQSEIEKIKGELKKKLETILSTTIEVEKVKYILQKDMQDHFFAKNGEYDGIFKRAVDYYTWYFKQPNAPETFEPEKKIEIGKKPEASKPTSKPLEIEEKKEKPPLPQKTYKNGFPEFAIALDSIKKAN